MEKLNFTLKNIKKHISLDLIAESYTAHEVKFVIERVLSELDHSLKKVGLE